MNLPLCLVLFLRFVLTTNALANLKSDNELNLRSRRPLPTPPTQDHVAQPYRRETNPLEEQNLVRRVAPGEEGGINYNPDGSPFMWLSDDISEGKNFFDAFEFFSVPDPTEGRVNYVNRSYAFDQRLAYVSDDNRAVMKTDSWTKLPKGAFRDSVRINTKKTYSGGLFILDLDRAPWGCAVWPAFWSTAFVTEADPWPNKGEIDILEGVHDNEHNQIAWHTLDGCSYDANAQFTGTIPQDNGVNRTNCYHKLNNNAGCNVVEWSRASYGHDFEAQGGGVIAMKWDENDISIWSFFRAAIPKDITAGTPNPSLWGVPSARLLNTKCNIQKYFKEHTIIINITLCGVWAGNSYATTNCPGTCEERLMEPGNFVNSSWSINSFKTYRKQRLAGNITQVGSGLPQAATNTLIAEVVFFVGLVGVLLSVVV